MNYAHYLKELLLYVLIIRGDSDDASLLFGHLKKFFRGIVQRLLFCTLIRRVYVLIKGTVSPDYKCLEV
jgi:hypothetical protein